MSADAGPSAAGESRKRDNSEKTTSEQAKRAKLSEDSTDSEMSVAVIHRKKWKNKARMAEYNLGCCMGILAVIFGYMIGSATAIEMNDARLDNKLEFSEIVQEKRDIYRTMLFAYLILNILVMLSSWPY